MKTIHNVGKVALAAVMLTSLSAFASDDCGSPRGQSDKYANSSSTSRLSRSTVQHSDRSGSERRPDNIELQPAVRVGRNVRFEDADAPRGGCPMSGCGNMLKTVLASAGMAYVGEHELAETLRSFQKSKAKGFGRALFGAGITALAGAAGLAVITDNTVYGVVEPELGAIVLTMLVTGIKLWEQEPQIIQDQVDTLMEDAVTETAKPAEPTPAAAGTPAATDADATKAKAADKK